jgi:hypothetical protein
MTEKKTKRQRQKVLGYPPFYIYTFSAISGDIFVPFVLFVLLIKNKEESTLMSVKGW